MLQDVDAHDPSYHVWRAKIEEVPPLGKWSSLIRECLFKRAVVGLDVQDTASVTSHRVAAKASLTRVRRRYSIDDSKSWTTQTLFRAPRRYGCRPVDLCEHSLD
jgi:hypothetical protein